MNINAKQFFFLPLFLGCLLFFSGITAQQVRPSNEAGTIKQTVEYLSSEELAGRRSGEKGDSLAAYFIRDQFANAGLELLFDRGIQTFTLVVSVETGPDNYLKLSDLIFEKSTDFLPYSFSANKKISAEVVFSGYGFDIQLDTLKWNDYLNVDVNGKWVLLLKGDPEINNNESVFASYGEERSKVLTAQDKGAAGVLFVAGPEFSEKDELQGLFYDKNSSTYSIPVMQITRKTANQILSRSGKTIEDLEKRLNSTRGNQSFSTGVTVEGRADVVQKTAASRNIAGIVEGTDPVLKDEYLVIGAHYDHLGMGGPGSGSRALDTVAIHPGADDNASGVAAVIELARRAAQGNKLRRSILFVGFGAEEMGLIGSTYFTANAPIDLGKVAAMINFDMVGRLDTLTRALSIGGTRTSAQNEEILQRLNDQFTLNLSPEGSGPSDHAAFYMQNIPVFFISTGAHSDYHTPGDVLSKINFSGISEIADYMWSVSQDVANRDDLLTFTESGSKTRRSRGGRLKVTLGVMPDFAGQEKSGLRIDAVTKGKPASLGGMLKGDIITAINGNPVGNIYDYMNRLNTFEEGQTISIDILREGKPLVLIVQL